MTARAGSLLAAGLVAAAVWLSGCQGAAEPAAGPSAAAAVAFRGFPVTSRLAKPGGTLLDTSGRPYDLAARTSGRVTVLFFGYSHCTDVCPATMAVLGRVLRALPPAVADRTTVAFVTMDPTRDTPGVLARWLARFDPRIVGLTGSRPAIARAAATVGLPPPETIRTAGGYDVTHGADVYAYGLDGTVALAYSSEDPVSAYLHDLPLLAAGGRPAPPTAAELLVTGGTGRIGPVSLFGAYLHPGPGNAAATITGTLTTTSPGADWVTAVASPLSSGFAVPGGKALRVPAGGLLRLGSGPGAVQVRLTGLRRPLQAGELVPVTITVAAAGSATVLLPVPRSPG